MELDSMYHQTNRLLQELTEEELFKFDKAHSFEAFEHIETNFKDKLNVVYRNCEHLDILANKEPPHRRNNGKYKVNQLKYDLQHIVNSFKTIQQRRYSRLKEEAERQELLTRKFTVNDQENDQTTIFIDHELKHHSKLQDSSRNVDDLISSGSSVLQNLREQRSFLKGAQRKILDLTSVLGMSSTVIRLIERTSTQDKYILYAGMFVILFILFLIFWYI